LNARVEEARANPTCFNLSTVAASTTVTDGAGRGISISGTVGTCPATTKTVTLDLTAVDASGTTLATASAVIYVP
jgi:hypothetical protein